MATDERARGGREVPPTAVRAGDPIHRLGIAKLTPDERLARGFAWIEFANKLRGIAYRSDGEWPRPSSSADDTTAVREIEAVAELEDAP
jgi:hypothetical protein